MLTVRAKRPCKWQNCSQVVDAIAGYCQLHQQKLLARRKTEQSNDPLRPFYNCKRWQTTRSVVLGRDMICKMCGLTASTVVHHVVDARVWIQRGNDFYDDANLQGVCVECHNAITAERQHNSL